MFNQGKGSGAKPPKLRLGRWDDDGVTITAEQIYLSGPRFLNGTKQYGGQRVFSWGELADVRCSFRGTGVIGKALAAALTNELRAGITDPAARSRLIASRG